MKYIKSFLNGTRTALSKLLAYLVIAYGIIVAVPALLVFGLAVIIAPKTDDKPKLSPEEVTARIRLMTDALKDIGLDDKLEVTVNGKLTTKS